MWDDLSIQDKAKIMALAVNSDVSNLEDIRTHYNSYIRGGYDEWAKEISKYKNINIDEDPDYDYKSFYYEDPDYAWDMLNKNSRSHFKDEYKKSSHPTFSNESIYSGYKNKFNPEGITGGTWYDDNNYQLSQDQMNADWDVDRTLDYIKEAEDHIVNVFGPDNSVMLHSVTVTPQLQK